MLGLEVAGDSSCDSLKESALHSDSAWKTPLQQSVMNLGKWEPTSREESLKGRFGEGRSRKIFKLLWLTSRKGHFIRMILVFEGTVQELGPCVNSSSAVTCRPH